ncbi:MAG: radical SAM protein [Acidobacteriota bacterium]
MRVAFSNLGCKLNQAEIDTMAQRFVQAGHEIVSSIDQAEVHVVNSCAVTHVAARDSRKIARRGYRLSSRIKTILTGCYAVAEPEEAARLAGVDLVVPNSDKDHILDRFHQAFPDCDPSTNADISATGPYRPISISPSRPLVKIEDGCNMKCSFCIIPSTRGRQRSRELGEIVSEVQALEEEGFREVVITGVQISSYRWREAGLTDLVRALLARTESIRLRLTSIAPWQFENELLDTLASGRVCRHFHLSLQSGCNETLQRMRRP